MEWALEPVSACRASQLQWDWKTGRQNGTARHSAVPRRQLATHEVTNQPPEWVGQNLYLSDSAFREAARREGGTWVDAPLLAAGELYGSASVLVLGDAANRNPPVLHSFNRFGERLD